MIHAIWQVDHFTPFGKEYIIPKGIVEIICNFSDSSVILNKADSSEYHLPHCVINGFNRAPLELQLPRQLVFFGVQFQPLAVKKIFGCPASEFAGGRGLQVQVPGRTGGAFLKTLPFLTPGPESRHRTARQRRPSPPASSTSTARSPASAPSSTSGGSATPASMSPRRGGTHRPSCSPAVTPGCSRRSSRVGCPARRAAR